MTTVSVVIEVREWEYGTYLAVLTAMGLPFKKGTDLQAHEHLACVNGNTIELRVGRNEVRMIADQHLP